MLCLLFVVMIRDRCTAFLHLLGDIVTASFDALNYASVMVLGSVLSSISVVVMNVLAHSGIRGFNSVFEVVAHFEVDCLLFSVSCCFGIE